MIKVNGNYKNNYTDMNCRWCHEYEETQVHILTECTEFNKKREKTTYETYFSDNRSSTSIAEKSLAAAINQINHQT